MNRREKRKRIRFITVLFIVLSVILLIVPNFIEACDIKLHPESLICSTWNNLRQFIVDNRIVIAAAVFGEILFGLISYLTDDIKSDYLRTSNKQEYFEFDLIKVGHLSEKDFPELDVSYIPWQDKKTTESLARLKSKKYILLAGVSGLGKTREIIEIINHIDLPKGSYTILSPKYYEINESLKPPTNISLRNVILLLDKLEKYEAIDEYSQRYKLDDSSNEGTFEKILSKTAKNFEDICDSFILIATIRTETNAWEKLKGRVDEGYWRGFSKLVFHGRNKFEAIMYCNLLSAKLLNIKLSNSSINSIANKYDGNFASIRDYLKIKNDENEGKGGVLLTEEIVRDFSGVYPTDWEQRFYRSRIESGKKATEPIFRALSIVSQTGLTPYKKLIVILATRVMPGWYPQRWKKNNVEKELDEMSAWIKDNDNGDVLNFSEAHVRGKGDLSAFLREFSSAVLIFSQESRYKYEVLPYLLSFAAKLSKISNNHLLALKLAKRAYEIDSENVHVLHTLAITYGKLGDDEKAIKFCKKALSLIALEGAPDFSAVYSTLGVSLSKINNRAEALKILTRGNANFPSSVSILIPLGIVLDQLNKSEDAVKYLQKANSLDENNIRILKPLGIALHRAGRPDEGAKCLRKALSLQPDDESIYEVVIRIIPDLSENVKIEILKATLTAVEHYDRDMAKKPILLMKLAETYKKLDVDEEALKTFLVVKDLQPNNEFVYSHLATVYLKLNRLPEASISAKKAVALGMDGKEILATQGDIEIRLKNYDEAFQYFFQAVSLDKTFGYGWSGLGQSLANQEKFTDSYEAFQKAIDLGQLDPTTWNGLGMSAKALGYFEIAENAFLESINLTGDHPMSWSHLGEARLALGKTEEAVSAYQTSIKLDDKNPRTWGGLGQALNKVGKHREAVLPHQRAIALGDANFANYYGLGMALHLSDEFDESIDAYSRSIILNPRGLARISIIALKNQLARDVNKKDLLVKIKAVLERHRIQFAGVVLEDAQSAAWLAEYGNDTHKKIATEICDQILLLQIEDPVVLNVVSSTYRHAKQSIKSINAAKSSIEKDKDFPSAWYTLGRAYEESGSYVDAINALKRALDINHDYPKAMQALKRIEDKLQNM